MIVINQQVMIRLTLLFHPLKTYYFSKIIINRGYLKNYVCQIYPMNFNAYFQVLEFSTAVISTTAES
jgi:hypothetical protein